MRYICIDSPLMMCTTIVLGTRSRETRPITNAFGRKQSFDGHYAAHACPEIGTSSQSLPNANATGAFIGCRVPRI